MLGEAQDVLLAAETSLARHRNRRRGGRQPTEEAPHCLTCCCLDNRQVPCSQRCTSSSSRRHSDRRNITVDELLREMSCNAPTLYDDHDAYANAKNEVEDGCESSSSAAAASAAALPLACPSRCAVRTRGGGSYCDVGKSPETTARSCERWLPPPVELLDNTSHIRSTKSGNVEGSERHSDGSKGKWRPPSDRKNSRRFQQLFGAGDRNAQSDEPAVKAAGTTDPDEEEESSSAETLSEEAHIRELKLVRWQFIERIHDEVNKLHRLQQHLDGCRSPPTPPSLARRRSVSTMTSARLLMSEPNVSGQF